MKTPKAGGSDCNLLFRDSRDRYTVAVAYGPHQLKLKYLNGFPGELVCAKPQYHVAVMEKLFEVGVFQDDRLRRA